MFILHSSNKTENLAAHLAAVIEAFPLSSPFAEEVFLVQSQGMERWLSQQLAEYFNVWANFQFFFPHKFFSAMALKIDSQLNDAVFSRESILWQIHALLRKIPDQAASLLEASRDLLILKQYLAGPNQALKCYQLARQMAQLFDQYQIMRPDMLDAWANGFTLYGAETERWQKALWRQLIQYTGRQHRGALWLEAINKLQRANPGAYYNLLPERISVFGLNTMPPLFLSYLQALSGHCHIHLFLLNPAQVFWADLAPRRQDADSDFAQHHPLLISLGQQGREFQTLLLETGLFDIEPESFESTNIANNLQQLQNDILINCVDGKALSNDGSISIHACHSRMREVEVVKDQLIRALENDHSLELCEIVVMAPDIQQYGPFISAVFNDIQHAIADRSLQLSNQTLDAFIRFLKLSQSRFGWLSVLELLEQPMVYPAFGLSDADMALIKFWVQDNQVRWGKSAEHKREFELPEVNANTWQAMLDRLLMGYAVDDESEFILDVLPYTAIEGASAAALGGLHSYLTLLFEASDAMQNGRSRIAWSALLQSYSGRLFGVNGGGELQQLHELLTELAGGVDQGNAWVHANERQNGFELAVIIAWLQDRISEQRSAKGFLRGQLTFCSMLPMRSIPFKVIALLGMNEGEFPKLSRTPSFDLLVNHFRKGDRSRRADERYQFLEILLSARQQLIVTYIGQSLSQNNSLAPSALVSELLDCLQNHYRLSGLVIRHPLHPFSARYFDQRSEALYSYSHADCEIAKALSVPKPLASRWWQGKLPILDGASHTAPKTVEISNLFSFFQHPQRYFMRYCLDLRFSAIEQEADECEPFSLSRLERYAIEHEWIQAELSGTPFSVGKLQAQGRWIVGALGEIEFERQRMEIERFVDQLKAKNLGYSSESLSVDISLQGYRLIGKLTNLYQNGSLFYRFAPLKGKDFVSAWLHHLIVNQVQPQDTHLVSRDEQLLWRPGDHQAHYLSGLIEIYLQGQQSPNAFFVEAALAYIRQSYNLKAGAKTAKSPLEAAVETLLDSIGKNYEPEMALLYGTLANPEHLFTSEFEQHCQTLLLPAWTLAH
jgi:exodeoxyribonuclease V gamma subunit